MSYEDAETARVLEDFGLNPATALVDLANDFVRVRKTLAVLRARDEVAQAVMAAWQEVQPKHFVIPNEMTDLALALDALARAHGEDTRA